MRLTISFLFIILSLNSLSQGFNNDQKFDEEDLRFLFAKNGLEVFKFPFKSKVDSSLNIFIEEYNNHNLVKKFNFYNDFKPILSMGDEPANYFFPKLNDSSNQVIRFYLTKNANKLSLTVKTINIERAYNFKFPTIKMTQTRAFDKIPDFISKKQPLFVFYGTKNANLISCPGDAPVKEIVKMYDYVVAVYADLIRL